MQPIDWILIISACLLAIGISVYTQRYMKSVADFLSGGRLAGRYLLAVSKGEMAAGAAVFIAAWEILSKAGFTYNWWNMAGIPIGVIVTVSGFVIYRYRETRAMTLAQFFEIRYSKSFRVFTGFLGFAAGLANFGIGPAIGAHFFVYFVGLPETLHIFSVAIPTYCVLMAVLLTISLTLILTGGLITVLVTNCVEGILSQILYLVLIFGLISLFSWTDVCQVLSNHPSGQSLLNPFDSMGLKDFNLWFVLMSAFLNVYGTMAWQNQSAFNSAPLSAHESRMGGILGRWREMGKAGAVTLLGICALTYLHNPHYTTQAALVHQDLNRISDPQTREQMEIPMALSHLLPAGLKGSLCVIFLMGVFCGDGQHMHSWGSLFIQDIVLPLRKTPLTPQQHIRWLRFSITGVALFAFIFGTLFRQIEYIQMWWIITTAIYVGGAGAAIIGGLYWKKGTTAGAWTALLTGSILSVGGILVREYYGNAFPFNPIEISFYVTLLAIFLYISVSLLTIREDFNMDRMLHRGKYSKVVHQEGEATLAPVKRKPYHLATIIGIDSDFTVGDKWIAGGYTGWLLLWFAVFITINIWNFIAPWQNQSWATYWQINAIGIPILLAIVVAVWFTWGGVKDILELFRRLEQQKESAFDNGVVINHQNLDEFSVRKTEQDSGEKSLIQVGRNN